MDVILIRKNLEKGKRNYLNHPIFVPVTLVSMLTMATVGYSAYSHYSGDSYDHILSLSLKNSSSVFNVEEAFSDHFDELTEERVNALETKAGRLDRWGEQLVLMSQTQELDMTLSWDQIIIEQQRAAQRELEEERAAQRKLEEERAAQRELEEEHALQQKLEEERALQQLDRQIAQKIEEERLAQKREEERVVQKFDEERAAQKLERQLFAQKREEERLVQKFDEERAAQKLERQLFAQKREEERVVQKFEKERVAQKLERQLAQKLEEERAAQKFERQLAQKLEEERAAQKFERQLAQNTRFSTVRSKPVQIAQLAQQRGQQTVRTKRADQKTDFSLSWDNIINDRPYFAQSKERGTTQSKERGTTISRFSPIAELKRSIQIVSRNMLRQYRSRVKRLPEGWPLGKGRVSSKFGWRGKRMHKGIDIAAKRGTPIYAVEDGFVERSKYLRGYGNLVEISHSEMYSTRYGHNSKNLVQEGDVVFKGQVIALVGSTGRSTGPHVHFEVRQSGVAINPIKYLGVMENFTLTENIKLSEHVKLSRR
ncbi:MAG: peptidoglycan DD-metalloendopeptidase family protein [Thiomargarita sp.]|nr:peptidoglycan DD-metalloendopeptidase family protein [Thiomargarita sp.]